MTRVPLTAALALTALLAACQPGEPARPASPAAELSISGQVSGPVVAGVTIRAAGASTASTTTDAAGRFRLDGLQRGQYLLSASADRTVAFAPEGRVVALLERDVAGQDFTSSAANVVQGRLSGPEIAQVPVALTGPVTRLVASEAGGFFRATGLPDGRYVVQPAPAASVFTPIVATVSVSGGATATADFAGQASSGPTHTVSGVVAGPAAAGVALTLSGDNTGTTLSDAAGHYAFVGLADGAYQVTLSPADGTLARVRSRAPTVAGADEGGVDFETYQPATPRWAYVAAQLPGAGRAIYQYAVDAAGGLSPLPEPTVDLPGPGRMVADPSGRWLYATSNTTGEVLQFAIGDDGRLAPLATPAVAAPAQPYHLAVDPGGRWLWVYGQAGGVLWSYAIGADGALTPLAAPAATVGAVAGLVPHPSGSHLYVVGAEISQLDVAADGSLAPVAGGGGAIPPGDAGAYLGALALDPAGRFAYATVNHPTRHLSWLVPYAVGADGALGWLGSQAYAPGWSQVSYGSIEVLVEPSGRFAYAAPDGSALSFPSGLLASYHLDLDGTPQFDDTVRGGRNPAHLAVDPGGRHLYAANVAVDPGSAATEAVVTWFSIGADGRLAAQGSAQTGLYAQDVTLVSPP